MIDNNLILILIFLVIILTIAIVAMMILIFKLFVTKNESPPPIPLDSKNVVIKKLSEEKVKESFFCPNHEDGDTTATCLICEEAFCEKCLIEHESLVFCKEHFRDFAQNKWAQITDIKTTPDTPEDALHVYHFKRYLWKEKKEPSYVLTHYKINIEEDFIESFVQLYVLDKNSERYKSELDKKKGQD